MTTTTEALAVDIVSRGVARLLAFVSLRAYRRTENAGFLFIGLALAVIPQLSQVVDQPIGDWMRGRVGGDHSFADSLRLYSGGCQSLRRCCRLDW